MRLNWGKRASTRLVVFGGALFLVIFCWSVSLSALGPGPGVYQQRDFDFATDFFGMVYKGNSRDLVDANILFYGAFEKEVLFFLRDTMLSACSDRPVFIDIGANSGQHSMFMSKYAREVHAFDPYPPILKRLHSNIEENQLSNVIIHEVGLGEEYAELPFFEPPDSNHGTGSFVGGFSAENRESDLRLKVVDGDTYFEEESIPPACLVKMDIEGYEKAALRGMRRVLERDRPILVVELTQGHGTEGFFTGTADLKEAFPDGYEFRLLWGSPESGEYQTGPLRPFFLLKGQEMVLAFPRERMEMLPQGID